MTDNFVGFARSPKPEPNRKVSSKEFTIHIEKPFSESHFIFTTKDGLSTWLGEVTKFDFRPGGKNRYQVEGESYGATYAMIQIPKQVALVTETLGEIVFSAKVKDQSFDLKVSFKKAVSPEDSSTWEAWVLKAIDQVIEALK